METNNITILAKVYVVEGMQDNREAIDQLKVTEQSFSYRDCVSVLTSLYDSL